MSDLTSQCLYQYNTLLSMVFTDNFLVVLNFMRFRNITLASLATGLYKHRFQIVSIMLWAFRLCAVNYLLPVGMVLHLSLILECKGSEDYMDTATENLPVEVTAVFINCKLDDDKYNPDSEVYRFEREELFKHNALRDCSKKLALTIKMTSEPSNSGDEYVPIDHVLEGPRRRRVRLLEPYVLRLRRDCPRQAYKLRFIDIVRGTFSFSDAYKYYGQYSANEKRRKRSKLVARSLKSAAGRARRDSTLQPAVLQASDAEQDAAHCDDTVRDCERTSERVKRQDHKHNVIIEGPQKYNKRSQDKNKPYNANKHSYVDRISPEVFTERSSMNGYFDNSNLRNNAKDKGKLHMRKSYVNSYGNRVVKEKASTAPYDNKKHDEHINKNEKNIDLETRSYPIPDFDAIDSMEKEFALYEICNPDVWIDVHLQMFQKLSTEKGNTLWNDFSRGNPVRVSSLSPDWNGRDMSVHYRPADIISRDEFTLPMSNLCLLVPLPKDSGTGIPSNINPASDNDEDYIVVPIQDVRHVDLTRNVSDDANDDGEERRKRVVVRVERAFNVMEDNPHIESHGSENYLTILHRKPHHSQIELEVRADENELVHVGSAGRIAIVVVDSTRRARSAVTVQVTNMGLAAAQFRAQIRDCDSGLIKLVEKRASLVAGPILLAPRHVGRLVMEMPVELPTEPQHCTVTLINDNDESVAVRDLEIRKGDRCFCVWHCDCVCYGENPKLPCGEMSEERQAAAGLPVRMRVRPARSASYSDCVVVNGLVIVVGVIVTLLFFGVVKGIVGWCVPVVGVWGLHRVLRPRRLACYYESELRMRPVQYDECGWPVHPDTRARTVQVVSKSVMFVVNTVLFVVIPGLVVMDLMGQMIQCVKPSDPSASAYSGVHTDAQTLRPRSGRRGPSRWMTPRAEELSANIWRQDPTLQMFQPDARPLLRAGAPAACSGSDSEQDDTAFVIMHMRNSTDSLARSQKKPDSSPSARKQIKHQKQIGTSRVD